MRGKVYWAFGIAGVIAIIASIVTVFVADHRSEQRQRADFRADVSHSSFVMAAGNNNPRIEDETKKVRGVTTTETTIEALVVVDGCTVELERKKGERRTVNRDGRTIEVYELDEAVGPGGREIEIDDALMSPLLADVEKYLASHADKFKHCLATT